MRLSRYSCLWLVLGAILLFYWASLPSYDIALTQSCKAKGMRARLSAEIYGDEFWKIQLDALQRKRHAEEARSITEDAARDNDEVSAIERRMDHLSEPASPEARRDRLEAEMRRHLESIAWLAGCEESVGKRLDSRP